MKPNTLVEVRNGSPVTTSLQIAQVFGKDHSRVLKDIRSLECSPEFAEGNFALWHYTSKLGVSVGRRLPMYYITRDGFMFLVMGFTGKVAAQFKEEYINAFNKMEHKLKEAPKNYVPIQQLNEERKRCEYWCSTAERYRHLFDRATDTMLLMAQNIERLSEMIPNTYQK